MNHFLLIFYPIIINRSFHRSPIRSAGRREHTRCISERPRKKRLTFDRFLPRPCSCLLALHSHSPDLLNTLSFLPWRPREGPSRVNRQDDFGSQFVIGNTPWTDCDCQAIERHTGASGKKSETNYQHTLMLLLLTLLPSSPASLSVFFPRIYWTGSHYYVLTVCCVLFCLASPLRSRVCASSAFWRSVEERACLLPKSHSLFFSFHADVSLSSVYCSSRTCVCCLPGRGGRWGAGAVAAIVIISPAHTGRHRLPLLDLLFLFSSLVCQDYCISPG